MCVCVNNLLFGLAVRWKYS